VGTAMLGGGEQNSSGRFLFPIIGLGLIVISALFLLSNRQGNGERETAKPVSAQSTAKSSSMGIADKIIVPLTILTMPFRGIEKIANDSQARSNVHQENERLKTRISQLVDAEMRANALAMKIKRFESLLSADVSLDIPVQKIAGRIVSETDGPFARSALLNVGLQNGVDVGHAVMTEEGLYGHIIAVGKRSSRVLLLEDINSRIAVMSLRSEARAIMVGSNTSAPKLSFVARDADWKDGDLIISSGDEGILPRGLPVGVTQQRGGGFEILLNTVGKTVDWVWVYPYVAIEKPEENPVETLLNSGDARTDTDDATSSVEGG